MKILSLCVSMLLPLSCMAYDFSALAPVDTGGNALIYYNINHDGSTVSVTNGDEPYSDPRICIPSSVDGPDGKNYTVTSIGYQAFEKASSPQVFLPNTVTEIQDLAFWCAALDTVGLSDNLIKIGNLAFGSSYAANGGHNTIRKIVLPEGLESIGNNAFQESSLLEIELPNSLKQLGYGVFIESKQLKKAKLPEDLAAIPESIFAACSSLEEVIFPKNLEKIESHAFFGCPLTSFSTPITLNEIGDANLTGIQIKDFTIPDNVTILGANQFVSNKHLEKITFSSGMTIIPREACASCNNLHKVSIPEGIKVIDFNAFFSCNKLTGIDLPEGLTDIDTRAFENCKSLSEVNFPNSIRRINSAFTGCTSLTNVDFQDGLESLEGTFHGCSALKNVKLPESLIKIGYDTFSDCESLEEIHIPYSVYEYDLGVHGSIFSGTSSNVHVARAIPVALVNGTMGGEECVLYVPRGAKTAYEEAPGWNCFKEIIEEDVEAPVFGVTCQILQGEGSVAVNGQPFNYDHPVAEVEYGKNFSIELNPAERFMVEKVLINSVDLTAELKDNCLEIENANTNYKIEVYFKRIPLNLSISTADSGSVNINIEAGNCFTCKIIPETGWSINTVMFCNGDSTPDNVTSLLGEDGTFTTPAIDYDCWLNVSFVKGEVSIKETLGNRKISVYSTQAQELAIDGAENELIEIFNINGIRIKSLKSNDSHITISLPESAIYIIRIGGKTYKIAL